MRCNVLVVEDEILTALDIEGVVEELGHHVVGIAPDSRSAMGLSDYAELALVDLDLRDGPTGKEVGRRLADVGVVVVYMTSDPAQLEGGVPGTVGVLPKPVNHAELRQVLHYAAARHEHDDQVAPPLRLQLFARTSQPMTGTTRLN